MNATTTTKTRPATQGNRCEIHGWQNAFPGDNTCPYCDPGVPAKTLAGEQNASAQYCAICGTAQWRHEGEPDAWHVRVKRSHVFRAKSDPAADKTIKLFPRALRALP